MMDGLPGVVTHYQQERIKTKKCSLPLTCGQRLVEMEDHTLMLAIREFTILKMHVCVQKQVEVIHYPQSRRSIEGHPERLVVQLKGGLVT